MSSSKSTTTSHTTSVVEVRESNIEMNKFHNVHGGNTETVYTIQLESVGQFEPEHVETVMIYDVSEDTSDTDTCPTPVFDERRAMQQSMESIDDQDENDEEVNAVLTRNNPSTTSPIQVERQRISFEENRRSYEKDHDLLRDSEVNMRASERKILKIRPSLRDILMSEERDSFYNSDKENYDEPIEFSEDEDFSKITNEMSVDSDTEMVFKIIVLFYLFSKNLVFILF